MGIFDDYLPAPAAGPPGVPRITVTPGSVEEPQQRQPRGIRNNNQGNIEDSAFARSQPGYVGSDGRFAKFDSPEAGQGAMESLLESYGRRGFNTPAAIIGRWAPASDGNPVGNYARYVAEGVGANLTDQLDLGNPDVRRKVAERISQFENGQRQPARATDFSAQSRQPAPQPAGIFGDYLVPQGQVAAPPASGPSPVLAGGEEQPAPVGVNTEGLSNRMAREGASPPVATAGQAFAGGALKGATFNFADELAGTLMAGGFDPKDKVSLNNATALVRGLWRRATGDSEADAAYRVTTSAVRDALERQHEQQPAASIGGELTGALATAPLTGGGGVVRGAGMGARALAGAKSGAAYGAIAGAGEGTDATSRAVGGTVGAGTGAVLGAAAPFAVEGVVKAGQGIASAARPVTTAIRGAFNPEAEAGRRVIQRLQADQKIGQGLSPAEFAAAKTEGTPVNLMDFGGDATRNLARSAATTSPEAKAALDASINQRFESQGPRVSAYIEDLFGGKASDVEATREALKAAAAKVNRPAYERVMNANPVVSVPQDILERPVVAQAMKDAVSLAKNRGEKLQGPAEVKTILSGDGFHIADDVASQGQTSLRYWDYVKKAMDSRIEGMKRKGGIDDLDSRQKADLGGLVDAKNALVAHLDNVAPGYKEARAGAAKFFGAEDAMDAGAKFVRQNINLDEARRTLGKFSLPERRLFEQGYVSTFLDDLARVGDRRNIVNAIAASPAARGKMEAVLGPEKWMKLEGRLRVEGLMDLARSAVQGNSTTARQIFELTAAGGVGGYGQMTGDPAAAGNALATWALLRGHRGIDARIARKVGEMLASNDPKVLTKGLSIVTRNKGMMEALRSADGAISRASSEQSSSLPALQAGSIGRADNQQDVPGPPAQ